MIWVGILPVPEGFADQKRSERVCGATESILNGLTIFGKLNTPQHCINSVCAPRWALCRCYWPLTLLGD